MLGDDVLLGNREPVLDEWLNKGLEPKTLCTESECVSHDSVYPLQILLKNDMKNKLANIEQFC